MNLNFRSISPPRGWPFWALTPALLLLAWSMATAQETRRIALVVGNQAYETVVPLDNPVADAELMAARLEENGFEVTLLADAGQLELSMAVQRFGSELRASGEDAVGLFYYAGHAVQSFGTNYILPVDIALTDAADLNLIALPAEAILRQMASAQNHTNILILDACRNNPFDDVPHMDDNGLAEMKAPTGTFMAYSTAPNSVALDGVDGNSPFTAALAQEMSVAGAPIEQVFKQVRSRVLEETGGAQTPWDTSSLAQDFFFTPATLKSPEELAQQRFFEALKETGDPVQMVVFLRNYPDSEYAADVRKMLASALDIGSGGTAGQPVQTAEPAVEPAPPQQTTQAAPAEPRQPSVDERTLIEAAQTSGEVEDYEAYLEAFPDGIYAELARMEVLTMIGKDPAAPAEGLTETAAVAPEEAPETASIPDSTTPSGPVFFDAPLTTGGPEIIGKSIETLITGSPLYPPVAGLPEELWKDQKCSNCHKWTRKDLCDQANTYLAEAGSRALSKEHPYGGGLKRNLSMWASGGCE